MKKTDRIKESCMPADGTIRHAMEAISRGTYGAALLVATGSQRFAGLVTDGDIRRALLAGLGLESPVSAVHRPASVTARQGMTKSEIDRLFSESVRLIPVLDEDDRVVDLAMAERRLPLPVAEPAMGRKELEYVTECVVTGWVSSAGSYVRRFEEVFAKACGVRHAIAVCNCTAGLHLGLLALGIEAGDEVIVPSMTFISSANSVLFTGAKPVLVDIDPVTWNIDPEQVSAAVTDRTRAIMPVHLYGCPADMDRIAGVAERHGLRVIEDAAEAQDAEYKGRKVGALGDVGCFSFFGNKIITTGEGGMIVTNQDDLAEKVRMLRDHGMSKERRYWHPVVGYNYRLTNIQAALGVAQMERLDEIIEAKRKLARSYDEGLAGIPGIVLPVEPAGTKHVYWMYTIRVEEDRYGLTRDELMEVLRKEGVETRPAFPPVHRQPVFDIGQSLPVAERFGRQGLNLPSFERLQKVDIDRIVGIIRTGCRGK